MEFLQYIAGDFRLPDRGKIEKRTSARPSSYVIARHQKGLTTVLVVDEAHHLSTDVLEEVRLLTNLETPEEKLLADSSGRTAGTGREARFQGSAAVEAAHRAALAPWRPGSGGDRGYIYRRLQTGGKQESGCRLFPMETILEVHRQSRGFPRLVNTLCENALIHGYARQSESITPEMIEEIAADFRLNVVHPSTDEHRGRVDSTEVERAARTLLDLLYASAECPGGSGFDMTMSVRGAVNMSRIFDALQRSWEWSSPGLNTLTWSRWRPRFSKSRAGRILHPTTDADGGNSLTPLAARSTQTKPKHLGPTARVAARFSFAGNCVHAIQPACYFYGA